MLRVGPPQIWMAGLPCRDSELGRVGCNTRIGTGENTFTMAAMAVAFTVRESRGAQQTHQGRIDISLNGNLDKIGGICGGKTDAGRCTGSRKSDCNSICRRRAKSIPTCILTGSFCVRGSASERASCGERGSPGAICTVEYAHDASDGCGIGSGLSHLAL